MRRQDPIAALAISLALIAAGLAAAAAPEVPTPPPPAAAAASPEVPAPPAPTATPAEAGVDAAAAGRFAALALDCVHREYPNKIAHVMNGDDDAKPPRALTPAFCGCFDWHSAVHGHWLLARLPRLYPGAAVAPPARAAQAKSRTPEASSSLSRLRLA